MSAARRIGPGVLLLAALGGTARVVGATTPLNPLIVAIALGAFVAASVGVPQWATPGVDRHKLVLEVGIVLLGAQLTVEQLTSTGPAVVGLAVGVVAVGVLFVELVGRWAGIESRTRSLLAAGASVCGVSAIIAVAGSIDSDEADISYAAGTVLLFDAVTLVAFPAVGSLLGIPDRTFGIWAGLSLFSTGPTTAVGFAVSETAGQWATVTKLVRNTLIGILAVAYAIYYSSGERRTGAGAIWHQFPKFLVGFLIVALVVNLGTVDSATRAVLGRISDWLFAFAFVGLGVELNPRRLRATGIRPLAVVLAQFLTVSLLALGAVRLLV
ncbi:YeiH family protein [Halobellus rarus]|uniref:YeiH family protein n=1 Tax=Halobellus rarus TaxID=1126237 RepID=A0ABD6CP27_9EURY|nr:putative sulfate exporter family transporter [Halobellus rarus]